LINFEDSISTKNCIPKYSIRFLIFLHIHNISGEKKIVENFTISENNIISVKRAKVDVQFRNPKPNTEIGLLCSKTKKIGRGKRGKHKKQKPCSTSKTRMSMLYLLLSLSQRNPPST
jgi:hypothetical protein